MSSFQPAYFAVIFFTVCFQIPIFAQQNPKDRDITGQEIHGLEDVLLKGKQPLDKNGRANLIDRITSTKFDEHKFSAALSIVFYCLCLETTERCTESAAYFEQLAKFLKDQQFIDSNARKEVESLMTAIRVFCVEHPKDGMQNEHKWIDEAIVADQRKKIDMLAALGYTRWPSDKQLRLKGLKRIFVTSSASDELRETIISLIPGQFSIGYTTTGLMDYNTVSRFYIELFDTGKCSKKLIRKMFTELADFEFNKRNLNEIFR